MLSFRVCALTLHEAPAPYLGLVCWAMIDLEHHHVKTCLVDQIARHFRLCHRCTGTGLHKAWLNSMIYCLRCVLVRLLSLGLTMTQTFLRAGLPEGHQKARQADLNQPERVILAPC